MWDSTKVVRVEGDTVIEEGGVEAQPIDKVGDN